MRYILNLSLLSALLLWGCTEDPVTEQTFGGHTQALVNGEPFSGEAEFKVLTETPSQLSFRVENRQMPQDYDQLLWVNGLEATFETQWLSLYGERPDHHVTFITEIEYDASGPWYESVAEYEDRSYLKFTAWDEATGTLEGEYAFTLTLYPDWQEAGLPETVTFSEGTFSVVVPFDFKPN